MANKVRVMQVKPVEGLTPDLAMEGTLSVAVVKADHAPLIRGVMDTVNLAGAAISVANPKAGLAVQTVAVLGGWIWNSWKFDRVKPVLENVVDRIHKIEHDYVRSEAFADVLWDALRRLGDQPDPTRRARLRNILLNVIDNPKDHTENRLFLRLADELSGGALEGLSVVSRLQGKAEHSAQMGRGRSRHPDVLEELTAAALIKKDTYLIPDDEPALNSRGTEFLRYCSEVGTR